MDILFLLIPLSVVFVFLILAVFAWALKSGQFDDIEREGERILRADPDELDADQSGFALGAKESAPRIDNIS